MWVPRCDEAGHSLEGLLMMTKLVAAKALILTSMNSRPGWLNSASHFTAYLGIYVAMLFLLCEGHRCISWPTLYASQLYSREASGTVYSCPMWRPVQSSHVIHACTQPHRPCEYETLVAYYSSVNSCSFPSSLHSLACIYFC